MSFTTLLFISLNSYVSWSLYICGKSFFFHELYFFFNLKNTTFHHSLTWSIFLALRECDGKKKNVAQTEKASFSYFGKLWARLNSVNKHLGFSLKRSSCFMVTATAVLKSSSSPDAEWTLMFKSLRAGGSISHDLPLSV